MLRTFNDIAPRTDKQGPGPDIRIKRARDLGWPVGLSAMTRSKSNVDVGLEIACTFIARMSALSTGSTSEAFQRAFFYWLASLVSFRPISWGVWCLAQKRQLLELASLDA
jgi:hypothetical protein